MIDPPAPAPPLPAGIVNFDFDGDGIADVGRWRYGNTEFKVWNSASSTYSTYSVGCNPSTTSGCGSARPVPGDYDGNGTTDAAVFSSGTWKYKAGPSAAEVTLADSLGQSGDVPVPANYDGTGPTDQAVFRPSNGTWYIIKRANSSNTACGTNSACYTAIQFGQSGDIPVPGDYDGDGTADIAVYRPSTGYWYIQGSSSGFATYQWGIASDVPVPAGYDSDGKTDIAVFRRTTGTWYILKSTSSFAAYDTYSWGNYGDQPAPADYDGDGKADAAVWRPTTGSWWILKSSNAGNVGISLGEQGDFAVPSAYLRQVGGTMTSDQLAAARLSPRNATGGTNLYSQNFSWGDSLVNLPGRSGLDLSFGISYNSLVWTKAGDEVYFDTDWSNVSPGFRFGFPTVQPAYYDAAKQKYAYMMVTPSGSRVEFRQTAASNVYETADSSYTQMVVTAASNPNTPAAPNDSPDTVAIRVTTTDGTQSTYEWKNGEYRCKEIKDRNGNYIAITNNDAGQMTFVTDTLGRVVTVDYDTDGYPTAVKQDWKASNGAGSTAVHNWATFSYTTQTVGTDFDQSSLTVLGPPSGTVLKVLDRITYADGSSTRFDYNGYAQVYKVSQIAADSTSHVLNYVRTNLQSPASGQLDCPRFTETRDWAENFNQNSSGAAQERVFTNSLTPNANYSLPDGHTGTATKIEISMADDPYNSVTKTYLGSSGWNEGLAVATEDWADGASGSERKRWTWTGWTQDDTSKTYNLNPRATETRVGDGTNTKKTTLEYLGVTAENPVSTYGLVSAVSVGDLSAVLKRLETDYQLSTSYTERRIIGLQSESRLYDQNNVLMSKVTNAYDQGGYTGTGQSVSATRHDDTNFGTSFSYRGNLTGTIRWDVTDPTNSSASVASGVVYNMVGAPISQTDPRGRTTTISYSDSWNDAVSRTTYAYPTTMTDPNGNNVTLKYRFDIGANVQGTSPAPAGQSYGKTTKVVFDSVGRIQRQSVYVNTTERAYTRYEYPSNGVQSQSYTPLVDADGDGNIAEDEVYSESWFDGSGRIRMSRTEHPGSTGGWTATQTEYNVLGRITRQSVPTEVSVGGSAWTPAGDDYRGMIGSDYVWLWNSQEYDWKGRVTRTVPSDSSGSDGKDTLISYDGCGCAGGQVMTIEGPSVARDDASGNARRKQKVYEDILGRSVKTEVYGWDGSTVYTTTVNAFNARDQITNTRQYAGSSAATIYQDVTMSYDGHGRMATRHYPIESTGTYTSWAYNADDTIASVTDPRGSVTSFTYGTPSVAEKRAVVTNIGYTPPTGMIDSPDVSLSYDAAGNRTGMDTDGVSDVTYAYDPLSRMTGETVDFDDLSNNLTLSYSYEIGGALKSITDPFGYEVDYTNDKTARVTAVSGAALAQHANGNFADNIKYRAFGATKQIDYRLPGSQTASIKMEYDNALRVSHSEAAQPGSTTSWVVKMDFSYLSDGRLSAKDDTLDDKFDRSNKYDFAGRLSFNQFGIDGATSKRVFEQEISYDHFSQMTDRSTTYWDRSGGFGTSYTNGRRSDATYDEAGNIVYSSEDGYTEHWSSFDAAGRQSGSKQKWTTFEEHFSHTRWFQTQYVFDGDGRPVIEKTGAPTPMVTNRYQIYSSVLGKVVSTVSPSGTSGVKKIYAGGALIASGAGDSSAGSIAWKTADPVTGTVATYNYNSLGSVAAVEEENEPLGQRISPVDPYQNEPAAYGDVLNSPRNPEWMCELQSLKPDGGDFWAMPVFCRDRMDNSLQTYFVPKAENPQKIGTAGSPTSPSHESPHGPGSPSDKALMFASSSTAKPKGEGKDGDGGCEPGNPKKPCVVEVKGEPPALDIPGLDASVGSDDFAAYPAQTRNPNCIENAVAGGKLGSNNIKENFLWKDGKSTPDGTAGHDGIHVHPEIGSKNVKVTALSAMAGRLTNVRNQGDGLFRLDILLDAKINGEAYYLVLKDFNRARHVGGAVGAKNLRISSGMLLGTVNGADPSSRNPELGESGLHVTLVKAANYNQYVKNIQDLKASPIDWFMDAARNPDSPFRCP